MSRTQNTGILNLTSGEYVLLPVLPKPVTGKKCCCTLHLFYSSYIRFRETDMESLIPVINKLQDVFNTVGADAIQLPQIGKPPYMLFLLFFLGGSYFFGKLHFRRSICTTLFSAVCVSNWPPGSVSLLFIKDLKKFQKTGSTITFYKYLLIYYRYRYWLDKFCSAAPKLPGRIRIGILN
jgi:hypothetical protein